VVVCFEEVVVYNQLLTVCHIICLYRSVIRVKVCPVLYTYPIELYKQVHNSPPRACLHSTFNVILQLVNVIR